MNECAFELLAPQRLSTLVFLGKLSKATLRTRESPISQSVRFEALVASLFILAVLSVSAFITRCFKPAFSCFSSSHCAIFRASCFTRSRLLVQKLFSDFWVLATSFLSLVRSASSWDMCNGI